MRALSSRLISNGRVVVRRFANRRRSVGQSPLRRSRPSAPGRERPPRASGWPGALQVGGRSRPSASAISSAEPLTDGGAKRRLHDVASAVNSRHRNALRVAVVGRDAAGEASTMVVFIVGAQVTTCPTGFIPPVFTSFGAVAARPESASSRSRASPPRPRRCPVRSPSGRAGRVSSRPTAPSPRVGATSAATR